MVVGGAAVVESSTLATVVVLVAAPGWGILSTWPAWMSSRLAMPLYAASSTVDKPNILAMPESDSPFWIVYSSGIVVVVGGVVVVVVVVAMGGRVSLAWLLSLPHAASTPAADSESSTAIRA